MDCGQMEQSGAVPGRETAELPRMTDVCPSPHPDRCR